MNRLHSKLQHWLNGEHLYCRCRDCGLPHKWAIRVAGWMEKAIVPILYGGNMAKGSKSKPTVKQIKGKDSRSEEITEDGSKGKAIKNTKKWAKDGKK